MLRSAILAAARSSRRADTLSIEVRTGRQIVERSPGIQQLDSKRRKAAAVPMKPGVRIHSVMSELHLAHLDVVHHQRGDAVRGKPRPMARVQILARMAALV